MKQYNQLLEKKDYKIARALLLIISSVSLFNIILSAATDTQFVFPMFITQWLANNESFIYVRLAILSLIPYFVFWFLCKQNNIWLLATISAYAIDIFLHLLYILSEYYIITSNDLPAYRTIDILLYFLVMMFIQISVFVFLLRGYLATRKK